MALCKSCEAEIVWATSVNGRPIPLDAKPKYFGPVNLLDNSPPTNEASRPFSLRGLFVILPGGARMATAEDERLRRPMHESHFATCPDAKKFRGAR